MGAPVLINGNSVLMAGARVGEASRVLEVIEDHEARRRCRLRCRVRQPTGRRPRRVGLGKKGKNLHTRVGFAWLSGGRSYERGLFPAETRHPHTR